MNPVYEYNYESQGCKGTNAGVEFIIYIIVWYIVTHSELLPAEPEMLTILAEDFQYLSEISPIS
jgi:hypothetical protein